ncbi:MAG: hypothetical protein C4547_04560 [Phycisphaerales bacterium]|nr:MAG: hypothetical protein C4547_04560 [Phycisphaerales bacterium]
MRSIVCSVVLALGCIAALTVTADAAPPVSAEMAARFHGTLAQDLDVAAPDELIPIVVVMRDQVSPEALEEATRAANRRAAVIALLKEQAAATQGPILDLLRAAQARGQADRIHPLWIANAVGAHVTPEVVKQLVVRDDVAYLHRESYLGEDVFPVEPAEDPNVRSEIECGVAIMNAPRVWDELQVTGRGSIIAVIDTGACITHSDLKNQIWVNPGEIPNNNIDDDNNGFIDDINGWNFESDNNNVSDQNGHGTHVSGTVAGDGTGGTQTGMAPDAEVMVTKFWNSFSGELSVWRSMEYATDNGAHATTASLGWPHSTNPNRPMWRQVCENTIAAGLSVIYAAGNEGGGNPPDNVRTPGDVPAVITVGATDCNDVIAGFSSRGPITWQNIPPYNDCPWPPGCMKPSISAPGVNTKSCAVCSGYRLLSGTSMATPHVAGTVALMLEFGPGMPHEVVKEILMDTSKDLGAPGRDNDYGAGRVDAYEATAASSGNPEPAACCFKDGSCEDLMREDCIDDGGRWNFGKECGSFNCPQPGACCVTNSECEILLERDCLAKGGEFMGEGLGCELICACDVIKKMKGKCKGSGTLKAIVKFRNDSWDGRTIKMGVGERLRFDVVVHGKKATLFTCCFNGPQEVSLIDPDGCLDPIVIDCP